MQRVGVGLCVWFVDQFVCLSPPHLEFSLVYSTEDPFNSGKIDCENSRL